MRFHRRCGDRVTLLNDNTTAIRNFVEFNHGLILSDEPLKDDVMFEVCVERKVNVWNGSLEIGVTTLDPDTMELPATATKLRNTAWIMSGCSVVRDGVSLVNPYGPELDTLQEGDYVGVVRTSKGELMFYLNSRCLGIAARDIPPRVFAVVDLYGRCVQVSVMHNHGIRQLLDSGVDQLQIEEDPNNDDTLTSSDTDSMPFSLYPKIIEDVYVPMSEGACALVAQDKLRFHPRCGILVKLSSLNKSAERARPLDDYNNGVVMTHRPLHDNELFEIRIIRLVDKWSGSIEVGVTNHNPATIRFPSTMTNMESGTIMMSGCKILLNGHGTCMEYGNYNLDELREGDTVGVVRKPNGNLHYYINGTDQGVAMDRVDQPLWGVIDLYGMTVKVTIVDAGEENNLDMARSDSSPELAAPSFRFRPAIDEDSLLFHTLRDSNVIILNDSKTAHRPNAFEFFNNGIVMTNRPLRNNELFQVRLDLVIPKWAGSIEIGVTQHTSNDIQLPFKMSNAKSGTWAMTGEDVIRDGIIVIPQYVRNLNRLVEGDTVGVMRRDNILHFFVNGLDQGPAAFNIPNNVYGIVDLYGRVAQATIVDAYDPPPIYSPESPLSSDSNATVFPDMCFHRMHGRNARLSRNRLIASRATVYSEFNDAVLFSSRPLRECDMFELRIDKMVDCWIGSIEIGVTAIRPEDLEAHGGVGAVASTATDLSWDTYILSGSAMMKDGECVRSGYPLDLDTLTPGSRVGMMWHADRSLHYYLDGMDLGKAWYVPHLNIYAVVDLYGQCTQVTILQNEERAFNYNGAANYENSLVANARTIESPPPPYWSFSEYCGDNVCLMYNYSIARRLTPEPASTLVFSSSHLAVEEIFEIRIMDGVQGFTGSFRMGVTDVNILNVYVNRSLPPTVACLPHYTAYIDGKYIKYSVAGKREQRKYSFSPSFEWLRPGDRVGLLKTRDNKVQVYYNSEVLDQEFENVPDKVYVVMELYGEVSKIQAVSKALDLPKNPETAEAGTRDLNRYYLHSQDLSPVPCNEVMDPSNNDDIMAENYLPDMALPENDLPENDLQGNGLQENGLPDTSLLDNGLPDNGMPENGLPENGLPDNGQPDFGLPDNGLPDTGLPDTGLPDDGLPDDGLPDNDLPDNDICPVELNILTELNHDEVLVKKITEIIVDRMVEVQDSPEYDLSPCGLDETPSSALVIDDERRNRPALPYTFHYVHGKNIKLCSSDTVAMRHTGYNHGVAIVSQPLKRGQNFRFRVDRVSGDWSGSACIGAVGALPYTSLPAFAMHLPQPLWALSSDLLSNNGKYRDTPMGKALDKLEQQSVLTVYLRLDGELLIDLNGKDLGSIGTIPEDRNEVYPMIDLYGRVNQISILLHPLVMKSGTSLDLPILTDNLEQDTIAEPEPIEDEAILDAESPRLDKNKHKAHSQDNLVPDELEPIFLRAGPSAAPDPPIPQVQTRKKDIKSKRTCPNSLPLHHTFTLPVPSTVTNTLPENVAVPTDNNEVANRSMQKSHSTQSFWNATRHGHDDVVIKGDTKNALRHTYSVDSQVGTSAAAKYLVYDTNKHQNDRYPEASDPDNLDNEIMSAMTLETGNLPDLSEEPSSSLDDSMRRDDLWSESLSVENLSYLNRVLYLEEEGGDEDGYEVDWEISCEHLHLVVKYWSFLVLPYPELRQAVSWGQVHCYCSTCEPDGPEMLAGWVRIERNAGAHSSRRGWWHLARGTLGAALTPAPRPALLRRPHALAPTLDTQPAQADVWFDEEGKPHHTVLALEIDIEGTDPDSDRLLAFLMYLRPHIMSRDDALGFDD